MRTRTFYLLIALVFLLSSCVKEKEKPEPDTTESEFDIVLPLAIYNFDQCFELTGNDCHGNPEDVFDVSILNTFELWHEAKLSFIIAPYEIEGLMLTNLYDIKLFVYDEDTLEWKEAPYFIDETTQYYIPRGGVAFLPNCFDDGTCTIHPLSSLVKLIFFPESQREDSKDSLSYKLTISLNKYDLETREVLDDVVTSSKIIDFHYPQEESVLETSWAGIDIDPTKITNTNQSFTLLAPLDLNSFMIHHPLHSMVDGSMDFALTMNERKFMDFHQDLQLMVYQYDTKTSQWVPVSPPYYSTVYTSVREFQYDPISGNTVCTGCNLMSKGFDEETYASGLPIFVETEEQDYLMFGMTIEKTKLILGSTLLRFIVQTDDEVAYYDVEVRN
ncbi:MAG: hypothetical protein K8R40_08240 [Anaerolineaceae bacterium]|nr:hypothetical protein [Anaerolineaceae bacterium]